MGGRVGYGMADCSYPDSPGTMVGDTEMVSMSSSSNLFRQIRCLQINILEGITEAMKIMAKDLTSPCCEGPSPPTKACRVTKKSISQDGDLLHIDNMRLHYFCTSTDAAAVAGATGMAENTLNTRAYTRFGQDHFRDFFCEVPFVQANNKWGLTVENEVSVFCIPGADCYELNIIAKCVVVYNQQ